MKGIVSNIFKNYPLTRTFPCQLAFLLILLTLSGFSQEKKRIDILQADYMEYNELKKANALVGNVQLKHNEALMWCDSAYSYTYTNRVDAFGSVHINQGDTINLYSNKIIYNGDTGLATATDNVILKNKSTTLYTDSLDYDMNNNIGFYNNYGKIVDSTNVLTSKIGQYYIDEDLIYFHKEVEAMNENYSLKSDTLKYNTVTGRIYILGPTTIKDSLNTIYAEDGWYDSESGHSELLKNPFVSNKTQSLKGDYIEYNRENGDGTAFGSIVITDTENQVVVKGNKTIFNENLEVALVTDSALMILYAEGEDSLYLHADTIKTIPDTIGNYKIIQAYWGIKFYRKDVQGLCDSLVYYSKDSTIQLYRNPVLWSENRQLTANNIAIQLNSGKPDEIYLNNNSFIILQRDSTLFDQIKGRNMIGYIRDNALYKIDVDGNGQTLYYTDDDDGIIGLNSAESSKITIIFEDEAISRIAFQSDIEGVLNPISR